MKKNNIEFPVRFVIAHKAEAQSLCEMFNLVLHKNTIPFKIYSDKKKKIWLIISGSGKKNSFIATKYLSKISSPPPWSLWINFGIAGHRNKKLGSLIIVSKVQDDSSKKAFYPGSVVKLDYIKSTLITLDKPIKHFPKNSKNLYDMESAGFIKAAEKVTTRELICIIKIVSDNNLYPFNKNIVSSAKELITHKKEDIKICILAHQLIIKTEMKRFKEISYVEEILASFHFTHSQQLQMRRNLTKWSICYPNCNPGNLINESKNAGDFIKILDNQIFKTIT